MIQPVEVLPIELIAFNGTPEEDKIKLEWSTASEINNSGFEVQRSEVSDGAFETIGWIPGNETSNTINTYTLYDDDAIPGVIYYYRLKQVNNDGSYQYSEIIEVSINNFSFAVNSVNNAMLTFIITYLMLKM